MFVQIHAAFITGREFLEPGQSETQGYGLYSYVLLGNRPPDDRTRARYLAVLRRYLLIERAEDFPPEVFRSQINVTYLPVRNRHRLDLDATSSSAESVLEDYDYARAQAMLNVLPGNHNEGPYLVSVISPLRLDRPHTDHYLFQDLSNITPNMADAWIKHFLTQVKEPRIWEDQEAHRFTIELRQGVATVAEALPMVGQAVSDFRTHLIEWISWK